MTDAGRLLNDRPASLEQDFSLGSVDYPGGFYAEQAPVHLRYICALNGVASPCLESGFDYCELGCGTGETTCLLAASNPSGRFVGIDLSATHIATAQALARDAAIDNVRFLNADIVELDADPLPDFDFVTLHGLYSWVPEEVQAAIRRFLRQKLRLGGLAYVSYNAMPGWGSVEGLRRYFVDTVPHREGTLIERTQQALDDLETLREQEAPYFRDNPCAAHIVMRLKDADIRYVAHEYLAQRWKPLHFSDVNRQMSEADLQFVASGRVIESLLEHSVHPKYVEALLLQRDPIARESLRDFIQNRFFRGDVFVKAPQRPRRDDDDAMVNDTLLGLIAAPVQIPNEIVLPDAPALRFEGEWFELLKQRLGYHARTVSEILNDDAFRNCSASDLIEGIKLLSAGGMLIPFAQREVIPVPGPFDSIAVMLGFNRVRLDHHDWSTPGLALGSPVTGSGVLLNGLEAAMLSACHYHDALAWLTARVQERGVHIRSVHDGAPVVGEAALRDALGEALGQFQRHKLPKLAYLGIVEGR